VRGIKAQTRDLAPHEQIQFNAVPVIEETLLLLGPALRQGKCTVTFQPSNKIIELVGSPGRLGQVVTNLVVNAVEASAPQGGPIDVRLQKQPTEIQLQISDCGCGVAPDILPKIFDPLFTTKPFGEATGLGLTIVHDIVTGTFGGQVKVESQFEQGTTFTLHFPLPGEVPSMP
jgi:signal transduction histidine kinase